jgi:hypothetical protein
MEFLICRVVKVCWSCFHRFEWSEAKALAAPKKKKQTGGGGGGATRRDLARAHARTSAPAFGSGPRARRPRAGDTVEIVNTVSGMTIQVGRVLEDDGSARPFRCEFNGSTRFYREEEIRLAVTVPGFDSGRQESRRSGPARACSACGEGRARGEFSSRQWGFPDETRRCTRCIAQRPDLLGRRFLGTRQDSVD